MTPASLRARWSALSLRGKLLLGCLLVQLAATGLILASTLAQLDRTLAQQANAHAQHALALIEQTVSAPLAQRDYATLQQSLDLVRGDDAIVYIVLSDHRGRTIAQTGWADGDALPARDAGVPDLRRADPVYHVGAELLLAGQRLGRVDLGLSMLPAREARTQLAWRTSAIGLAALGASVLLLAAIAMALTRHLAQLTRATERVAAGDFAVELPLPSHDEVGLLSQRFMVMAAELERRMTALQASEQRQRDHLAAARDEQSRLTTLLGAMQGGILFVDDGGQVVYANQAFMQLWSLPWIATGSAAAEVVAAIATRLQALDRPLVQALLPGGAGAPPQRCELLMLDQRIVVQRCQPVAAPSHGGWIWFHDDVTHERHVQARAQQALHDTLTQLLNRRGLYEALQAALGAAAAQRLPVALMFIDLDDFKYANDIGGHRLGDQILVAVAGALSGQLRRGEIVARLGGDEFAVVCPGLDGDAALPVAQRLVQAVAALGFDAGSEVLRVGCSIGIADHPRDAVTVDELLACADRAMYQAKQAGKNTAVVFRHDPQHARVESARLNWNARLHNALAERRFVLHFQPVCRASDLGVAHHEALLRLLDDGEPQALVPPGEFIAHAERSGKVRQLDRWVFEQCVVELAASPAAIRIAANLSVRSLEDRGFPDHLHALLQRHDVDPRRLLIELTETAAIGDATGARELIAALRRLGCQVHLDDFGAGFNSFAQLKLLDVDAVKIDGGFVRDLAGDTSNRLFVASMIEIAHSLGKLAIAEHVEDAATLDLLVGMGIDLVQGFHLGRPAPQMTAPAARLQLVSAAPRLASGN